MNTQEKLQARIQPVYAQFLDDHGIQYGDISPELALAFEKVEDELASLIDQWIGETKAMEKVWGDDDEE